MMGKNYSLERSKIEKSFSRLNLQYDFGAIEKLTHGSYVDSCYLFGGYIRDIFLGNQPEDIDFKAVSKPRDFAYQIKKVQSVILKNTAKYKFAKLSNNSVLFRWYVKHKITEKPMRVDLVLVSYYPSKKIISGTLPPRVRTNYSVNSFYFDVNSGDFYSFHESESDLKKKNIRLIDPEKDLAAQPMLLFRGIYLASKLSGFRIEPKTLVHIKKQAVLAADFLKKFSITTDPFILSMYSSQIFKGLKYDAAKYFYLMNEAKLTSHLEDYIKNRLNLSKRIFGREKSKPSWTDDYRQNLDQFLSYLLSGFKVVDEKSQMKKLKKLFHLT